MRCNREEDEFGDRVLLHGHFYYIPNRSVYYYDAGIDDRHRGERRLLPLCRDTVGSNHPVSLLAMKEMCGVTELDTEAMAKLLFLCMEALSLDDRARIVEKVIESQSQYEEV